MSERVLTYEEISKIASEKVCPIVDTMGFKIVQTCCEAQDKATLKTVGEYVIPELDKISSLVSDIRGDWTDPRAECRKIWEILDRVQKFLYGEMPEEVK